MASRGLSGAEGAECRAGRPGINRPGPWVDRRVLLVTRRVHRISQHRRPFPACFRRSRTTRRTCSPPAPPASWTESPPLQESVLSQPTRAARRALREKALARHLPSGPHPPAVAHEALPRMPAPPPHARIAPAPARLRSPLRAAPSCRRPFPQQVALQKRLGQITSQAAFQNLEFRRSHRSTRYKTRRKEQQHISKIRRM